MVCKEVLGVPEDFLWGYIERSGNLRKKFLSLRRFSGSFLKCPRRSVGGKLVLRVLNVFTDITENVLGVLERDLVLKEVLGVPFKVLQSVP